MAKKLKVMFSTHGLVEGDFGFELDEKGYPTSKVISKKSYYRTGYRRTGLLR